MEFDDSELAQGVLVEREQQLEAWHLKEVATKAFPTLAARLVFVAGEAGWEAPGSRPVSVDGSLEVPESQKEQGVQSMVLRACSTLELKDGAWQMSRSPQIKLQLVFDDHAGIDLATLQPPVLRSEDSGLRDEAGNPFDDEDSEAWVVGLIEEAFMTDPQETATIEV